MIHVFAAAMRRGYLTLLIPFMLVALMVAPYTVKTPTFFGEDKETTSTISWFAEEKVEVSRRRFYRFAVGFRQQSFYLMQDDLCFEALSVTPQRFQFNTPPPLHALWSASRIVRGPPLLA